MVKILCKHRHTIESHPACFARGEVDAKAINELESTTGLPWYRNPLYRIGYLDIEVDNLKANFGTMLSWAIKERDGNVVFDVITKKELFDGSTDERIVRSVIDELKKYRIIITYYGTNMDIPYIRTKALYYNIPFPSYGEIFHWDIYYTVKAKLQLSRNSLGVVTSYLGIPGKTLLDAEVWNRAKYGDEEALDRVVEHNIADVEILEELHNKISPFRKWIKTSI